MGEVEKRQLFPTQAHRDAADTFAKYADQYQTATGDFAFRSARNMALLLSTSAVHAALKHNVQTAQALANAVTLEVGSRKHEAALMTLQRLVRHLEDD